MTRKEKEAFSRLFSAALDLEAAARSERPEPDKTELELFERLFGAIQSLNTLTKAKTHLRSILDYLEKHPP